MATEAARRLFTVDDYHRMAEAGILTSDDRVELLGGEIVEMTPIGPSHSGCVTRLLRWFVREVGDRATVRVQDPVILDDLSEPQPDISVCHLREDDYSMAHPRPDELFLVIEVADTSQRRDRELKIPRYGRTGVRETWLVDLDAERIEVYRGPGSEGYSEQSSVARGASLTPAAFPELSLAVDEILGPRPDGVVGGR